MQERGTLGRINMERKLGTKYIDSKKIMGLVMVGDKGKHC